MRFNDTGYLTEWKAKGKYPAIHDDMATGAAWLKGNSALDLCCSTGLLAQRLHKTLGMKAVGIDGDPTAIANGRKYGITVPLYLQKINREHLLNVLAICQDNTVDTLIARRCFPELFGDDPDFGREFASAIALTGINEVLIEGRMVVRHASNALSSVEQEIALLADHYDVKRKYKNVVYLVKKFC